MDHFQKWKTVDTTTMMAVKIIHTDFDFNNVISILGFFAQLTVFGSKSCMLWIPHTYKKLPTACIIKFIFTNIDREKNPFKIIRVDRYGML